MKNTIYGKRSKVFYGLQKTKRKMRGTFRKKATATKKAPAGAFFRTQFNRLAKLSCRKYWRDRAVL
ncbi:MAG: hypothetical protein E7I10_01905, partial [Enterobacter asburiae]|nr:hypothetical protein [Enterobacter asburiae]